MGKPVSADQELCEIEMLVVEIGAHLAEMHLNMRMVWDETVRPTLEAARRLEGATSAEQVEAKRHLCQAVRELAKSFGVDR